MFKRTEPAPAAPAAASEGQSHLSLTVPADAHQLQGYVYCAALSAFRALGGVQTGRDADYLFTTLANLQQIALKLHVADADQADIARWTAAAETKMRDLRRREFHRAAPKPLVQIEASALQPEERREIA